MYILNNIMDLLPIPDTQHPPEECEHYVDPCTSYRDIFT